MAKRTAQHLHDHLSLFKPEYPIQKGYIARLLKNDRRSASDAVAEVKGIVQTALPDKQVNEASLSRNVSHFKKLVMKDHHLTHEWSKLVELFIQPFPITFRSPPIIPAFSQPEHTSVPSPSRHPELTTSSTSEMLLQPDIPVTSTIMQPMHNSTINSSFFSATCKLPSPRKLKRDCANCVNKQCTIMNMLQKNKRLHQQLREFKMLFMEENGNFSMKRFNENIKRQTQSVTDWKTKYYTLMKAYRVRSTHKLFKLVHKLEQKVKTLEGRTITAQEKNSNMASVKVRLESMIETTNNFNANLKQENEQLKNMLEKTETANAHFKRQHEHLRSILDETENENAHLKCYRQASHAPEMEIKEELPFEAVDNHGGNFALENEEINQEHIYEGQAEVESQIAACDKGNEGDPLDDTSFACNINEGHLCAYSSRAGHNTYNPSDHVPTTDVEESTIISDITSEYQTVNTKSLNEDVCYIQDVRSGEDEKKHPCSQCKYTVCDCKYANNLYLNIPIHKRIHVEDKLSNYDVCGLTFTQITNLQGHLETYVGKVYRCKVCGLECLHNVNCKKLQHMHSEEKNYMCDICGYQCQRMSNLKSHNKIHTGEKPYQCDVCGKSFAHTNSLKAHKRVHTGERPYKCNVCGFAFKQSSSLNTHKMIHTGEKPYMCDICGFQVNRKDNLKLHTKIHK